MTGTVVVADAVQQTWLFIGILLTLFVLTARHRTSHELLPISVTHELKGLAILAVVFAHIGLFLVDDHRFLSPLSGAAGVGVNVFLFLSGYGLTLGMLGRPLSALEFYRRRALRIYLPFWLALIGFVALDASVLNRTYPAGYVERSFIGFFPHADLWSDVNSPFWYITWILLHYLLFPLVFLSRRVWLSALVMFAFAQALVIWNPPALAHVAHLYAVHTVAFPLGMLMAGLFFDSRRRPRRWTRALLARRTHLPRVCYYGALIGLVAVLTYTLNDSGIGESAIKEQTMSIAASLALVALFSLKRIECGVLTLVGVYSYEIYLLHWPLMSRYDGLYSSLPAALATCLYLATFIAMGWIMQRTTQPVAAWLETGGLHQATHHRRRHAGRQRSTHEAA